MNITFEELRQIKHKLPTGSIAKIASNLGMEEQKVRDFFGAQKFNHETAVDWHYEPGPNGGIVNIHDTSILDQAMEILKENNLS